MKSANCGEILATKKIIPYKQTKKFIEKYKKNNKTNKKSKKTKTKLFIGRK